MTCIHGLDEINCPICRMTVSSMPITSIDSKNPHYNELKPHFHRNEDKSAIVNDIVPKILQSKAQFDLNHVKNIPEARLLNQLPNFENDMFIKRLNELDLNKSDVFKISKKIEIENPEWDSSKNKL